MLQFPEDVMPLAYTDAEAKISGGDVPGARIQVIELKDEVPFLRGARAACSDFWIKAEDTAAFSLRMARSRAWIRSLVLAVSDCPVLLSGVRRINSGYFNFKGMVEFRNYKIMRQTSSVIIGWVTRNERDLIIAFVFAIIGAVFWDAVKTGSVAGVRQLKNKLAEQSVARLQERIVQLQKYRDTINSYISSDRALYLATLQLILAILILACMGAAAVILDSLLPLQGLRLSVVALFIFAIAIILGMYGVQLAKLSTRSELSAKVSALDSEINALKAKLDLRTRKVAQ